MSAMYLQNKYTRWYYNIIQRAQTRIISGYTERHHIIPRSLGGSNNKINLVDLTAREHFVCHWLLTKMVEGLHKQKMVYALHAMLHLNLDRRYKNSIAYQQNKIEAADYRRQARKGTLIGDQNYNYGNRWTLEQKAKMSEYRTGKCFRPNYRYSDEAKHKMRQSAKERWTDEERQKFSQLRLSNMYNFTCPHCGQSGKGKSNYIRWHGDNCRSLKIP
jgi:hypothetical protein